MKAKQLIRYLLSPVVPLISIHVFAAPGVLQDAPLIVSIEPVQPNILFMLDDSGSMASLLLYSNSAVEVDGVDSNALQNNLDFTPDNSGERKRLCPAYNVLAYDPTQIYSPWPGVDENGVAFQPVTDLTSVRRDPYIASDTVNISNNRYVLDDLNDGIYVVGDCDSDNVRSIADETDPVARTNYGNWYVYYRSRQLTAKASLSNIIYGSRARVGATGLFKKNGDALNRTKGGVLIKDIDDSQEDETLAAVAAQNKAALLQYIHGTIVSDTGAGTPLKRTLLQAGRYFNSEESPDPYFFGVGKEHAESENTINSNTPILNAANSGACQQNFAVLFSDGFMNRDSSPGLGNVDGDNGPTFADTYSNTLADIAMYYFENDLVPDGSEANQLNDYVRARDPRTGSTINRQHMTTYTIAFGVNGNLSGNPGEVGFDEWPEPVEQSPSSIDDMRHAAWNGRGRFLNSSNPRKLNEDLDSIFDDIYGRTEGTAAAATVSSGLLETTTQLFTAKYDSSDWSGDLTSQLFDSNGLLEEENEWSAKGRLNKRVEDDNGDTSYTNSRTILTYSVDLNDFNNLSNTGGVVFDYANLHTSQQAILTSATFDSWTETDENFAIALVDYLKGSKIYETGVITDYILDNEDADDYPDVFRSRNGNYLGAIVNSSPQYVGPPNDKYPDQIQSSSALYNSFKTSRANRTPLVYVGSNDGMLHAFNAAVNVSNEGDVSVSNDGGEEVFTYIPGLLTEKLPNLASPNYQYQAYVDATPTVRDVYIGTDSTSGASTSVDAWRTYLVGGFRSGAKGIYVLDVTDPVGTFASSITTDAQKAASIVKFEYTHPDLGYTFSRPQIAKLNDGKWVAIFGNGYNADGDGRAKLFIVDLATGQAVDILDTGVGNNAGGSCLDEDASDGDAASDCNGLSSPTLVDLNGDFKVDRVYAGDLHGNMWAFDIENTSSDAWTSNKLFTANRSGDGECTSTTCRQPITVKPEVTLHPSRRSSSTKPNILVFFGTGQYLAEGDNATTERQSFYAVWDAINVDDDNNLVNNNLTKQNLVERTFSSSDTDDGTVFTIAGDPATYITSNADGDGNYGWYVDLELAENNVFLRGRVVINPLLSGEVVFFIVSVPRQGASCDSGSSNSYLVSLDLLSGLVPDFTVFPDGDGSSNSSDTFSSPVTELTNSVVGMGISGIENTLILTNENSSITTKNVTDGRPIPSGRKSWSIIK